MGENGNAGDPTKRAMENAAESQVQLGIESADPQIRVLPDVGKELAGIPSGIGRLDERVGGLERGGVYLVAGVPGPAKLVAALQFLHAGLSRGERAFLLTTSDAEGILHVARAWGSDLEAAWREKRLGILGFKEDFEMRVLRSADPDDAMQELEALVPRDVSRIAVEPGSMFLQGGTRTLLGRSFLEWCRKHPATVCATLSIDSAESLPSSAEWLVGATNGVFVLDRRPDGLYQIRLNRALPGPPGEEDPVTLQLTPEVGLVGSDRVPSRRRSDRPSGDFDRVLLISLGDAPSNDLQAWVQKSFEASLVTDPLDAIAVLQQGTSFGSILVSGPRRHLGEAVRACRALRPLTGAAIVFASDDAIRSTDRVNLLDAGADDCLSGGVDFAELDARLKQAAVAGGKPVSPPSVALPALGPGLAGRVSGEVLSQEAQRRAGDPKLSVFSMVRLTAPTLDAEELGRALSADIRDEDGDLVACTVDGCVVLLQGARRDPVQAFLARFRSGLEKKLGHDPILKAEVLTYPAEKSGIQGLIDRLNDPDFSKEASRGSEGPDGQEA